MADQIKKILSLIFLNKIRLNITSIITVSNVKVTSDLKLAKIYISVYNKDSNYEDIEYRNIIQERKKIRYELGANLQTKYVPEIKFFKDDSMKDINKIFHIK